MNFYLYLMIFLLTKELRVLSIHVCKQSNSDPYYDMYSHRCYNNTYNLEKVNKLLVLKNDNKVYGIGYKCIAIEITSATGYGQRNLNSMQKFVSSEECNEMLKKRMCFGKKMVCDNNEKCTYNVPLLVDAPSIHKIVKKIMHCTIEPVFIKSRDNSVIAANCNIKDFFCSYNMKTFIWDTKIIKKFKYELVKNISFYIDRQVYFSNEERIMLLTNNMFIDEGIEIMNSTSSFYLVDIKDAERLEILRLEDYISKLNIINNDYRDMVYLKAAKTTECNIFLNTIHEPLKILKIRNIDSDQIDFIYSDNDAIYRIPRCKEIISSIKFNRVEKCYRQIEVTYGILVEGKYTEHIGYLNENGIIKETSEEILCLSMNSVAIYNLTLITRLNKHLEYTDMRPNLIFKYLINKTLTSQLILTHEKDKEAVISRITSELEISRLNALNKLQQHSGHFITKSSMTFESLSSYGWLVHSFLLIIAGCLVYYLRKRLITFIMNSVLKTLGSWYKPSPITICNESTEMPTLKLKSVSKI